MPGLNKALRAGVTTKKNKAANALRRVPALKIFRRRSTKKRESFFERVSSKYFFAYHKIKRNPELKISDEFRPITI
jgi:hypothetical protein